MKNLAYLLFAALALFALAPDASAQYVGGTGYGVGNSVQFITRVDAFGNVRTIAVPTNQFFFQNGVASHVFLNGVWHGWNSSIGFVHPHVARAIRVGGARVAVRAGRRVVVRVR